LEGIVYPIWIGLFGLLVGTLSGFTGVGGGIIIVPTMLLLGFMPQKAVGTSLFCIFFLSISGIIAHYRLENIDYKFGLFLAAGAIIGAQIGARITEVVPTEIFKKLFAIMLVLIAIKIFFQR
jgi:uncharacterized membrane protein YfcA